MSASASCTGPQIGMIRLLEQRTGAARVVLPAGRGLPEWHQALTGEIVANLTPAHAALLATPVPGQTGTTWFAGGSALRRYADLETADRNRLTEAVAAILSDIRRLAESGKAAAVAAAWPALRSVPDLTHLFAVDGRPVLAAWGSVLPAGGVGPLAALDDGVAWRPRPRVAWPVYAATMVALAALALFVGLLVAPLIVPSPAACQAAPGQLALLLDQSREAARTDALRGQLAQLQEGHGTRALACPIPHQAAAPPPQPPPRADLPRDRWDRHDLTMLQGCWNNSTQLGLRDEATGRPLAIRAWVFCFDGRGSGHQTITFEDGKRCENDLAAEFDRNNALVLRDGDRCRYPGLFVRRGQLTCQRESDVEAACTRRDLEGPATGHEQSGRFRRAEATQ